MPIIGIYTRQKTDNLP